MSLYSQFSNLTARSRQNSCSIKYPTICSSGYKLTINSDNKCEPSCIKITKSQQCATNFLVCGSNNRTYANICEAENDGVDVSYVGPCREELVKPAPPPNPPDRNDICLNVYSPVCDTNNSKTYANSCEAIKAGIFDYTYGACPVVAPNFQSKSTVIYSGNGFGKNIVY